MGFLFPFFLFCFSLGALILATNYLLRSAERLGIALNISPFVVGAVIVAFGTSLPEAAVALFSVFNGVVTIPVAQTVGSNIANTLLILGCVALLVRRLVITKNLIDVELSLIVAITLTFVFVVFDGTVYFYEGVFLLIGFICYLVYIFMSGDQRTFPLTSEERLQEISVVPKHLIIFIAMALVIAMSAHFTIVSTQMIASIFSIPEALVAITVLALGTSLPELIVSIQAALRKEIEVVIGNIIGSNTFNILFVVGLPALFSNLIVDEATLSIGVPALVGATVLFIVSTLSNRVHIWEGLFYILLYFLLMTHLFGIL